MSRQIVTETCADTLKHARRIRRVCLANTRIDPAWTSGQTYPFAPPAAGFYSVHRNQMWFDNGRLERTRCRKMTAAVHEAQWLADALLGWEQHR